MPTVGAFCQEMWLLAEPPSNKYVPVHAASLSAAMLSLQLSSPRLASCKASHQQAILSSSKLEERSPSLLQLQGHRRTK
jgi:hypothetical protein